MILTKSKLLSSLAFALASGLFIAPQLKAQTPVDIPVTSLIQYDDTGFAEPSIPTYRVGVYSDDSFVRRSLLVFDRSAFLQGGQLIQATLGLYNPFSGSDQAAEILEVRGLTLSSPSLSSLLDGSAGLAGFEALGDTAAPLFASVAIAPTFDGEMLAISLNQDFLNWFNQNTPTNIALSLSLSSLSGTNGNDEYAFGGSWVGGDSEQPTPTLSVVAVPEPGTYALAGSGGLLLLVALRRKRRKAI